jgi:hypothetical protein
MLAAKYGATKSAAVIMESGWIPKEVFESATETAFETGTRYLPSEAKSIDYLEMALAICNKTTVELHPALEGQVMVRVVSYRGAGCEM